LPKILGFRFGGDARLCGGAFYWLAGLWSAARVRESDEESSQLIVRETSRVALHFIASIGKGELLE
jgi:hypothetical protein